MMIDKTMKELTLTVPTTISELSLGQFLSLCERNYQEVLGIGDEEIFEIPRENRERAYDLLKQIEIVPAEYANEFEVGGEMFVVNWRLDDWTLEERLIFDRLAQEKSVLDLHRFVALFTRHAIRRSSVRWGQIMRRGFKNTIRDFRLQEGKYAPKEWSLAEYEKRCELFHELMPADRAYVIAIFFGWFGQEMIKTATGDILQSRAGI